MWTQSCTPVWYDSFTFLFLFSSISFAVTPTGTSSNNSEPNTGYSLRKSPELGHAIDPCNIIHGPKSVRFSYGEGLTIKQAEDKYPVRGLISCLRGENSVAAKRPSAMLTVSADDSYLVGAKSMPPPTVIYDNASLSNKAEKTSEPEEEMFSSFCGAYEQIGESVCDWFGVEVVARYLSRMTLPKEDKNKKWSEKDYANAVANSLRILCSSGLSVGNDEESNFGEHPTPKRRMNNILSVHPKLRELMGCDAKLPGGRVYCDGKTSSVTENGTPKMGHQDEKEAR